MSATTIRSVSMLRTPSDTAVAASLGRSRKRSDRVVRALCLTATVIGLLFLASILLTLFVRGLTGMSLTVFTTATLPPGSNGGLANAIVGSIIQTMLGAAIGTPIGLMVGTYLAEYA
ncbi:MAG: phosphate ABC transporter permease PtsA, partial [Acetobacteraceae bacterium]